MCEELTMSVFVIKNNGMSDIMEDVYYIRTKIEGNDIKRYYSDEWEEAQKFRTEYDARKEIEDMALDKTHYVQELSSTSI